MFLWNLPSDSANLSKASATEIVSILVFVELALGPDTSPHPSLLEHQFQSLFLWNLPSDSGWVANPDGSSTGVSILVFVELALGPDGYVIRQKIGVVSILVFVELALGLDAATFSRVLARLFQSFFLWNLPSDSNEVIHPHSKYPVSILVFVELALGPYQRRISASDKTVSILVFVELALGLSWAF